MIKASNFNLLTLLFSFLSWLFGAAAKKAVAFPAGGVEVSDLLIQLLDNGNLKVSPIHTATHGLWTWLKDMGDDEFDNEKGWAEIAICNELASQCYDNGYGLFSNSSGQDYGVFMLYWSGSGYPKDYDGATSLPVAYPPDTVKWRHKSSLSLFDDIYAHGFAIFERV